MIVDTSWFDGTSHQLRGVKSETINDHLLKEMRQGLGVHAFRRVQFGHQKTRPRGAMGYFPGGEGMVWNRG